MCKRALRLILWLAGTACAAPSAETATFFDTNGLTRLDVSAGASIVAGHTLWNFAIEPVNAGWEINTIDAASGDRGFIGAPLRQVQPNGQATVFTDLNAIFPPGEDATGDSQFAFQRAGLLVLTDSESATHLDALFTGFEPIRQTGSPTKFAHVVIPTGNTGIFRGAFAVQPPDGGSPQPATYENVVFGTLPAPGDYNSNGSVDAADYVVWRDTLGQLGEGLAADGDGNQQIGAGDYDVWKMNFGKTGGVGSAIEVIAMPEPSSFTIVFSALVAACRRRTFDVRIHKRQ
jgi:hypothetical protein